jgi:hypothetical protein
MHAKLGMYYDLSYDLGSGYLKIVLVLTHTYILLENARNCQYVTLV